MNFCSTLLQSVHNTFISAKNQPVKGELPVWSAERSITTDQLLRKRAEFWDTSPAYEGRKEIWDALKAAAEALETGNRDLAQAILDGASITLPTGFLFVFVTFFFLFPVFPIPFAGAKVY